MLSASLNITPLAALSRPVAGIRKHTVIVTVPGSPKAAVENLEAIIKVLPHACQLAAGTDSRRLHDGDANVTGAIQTNAGHGPFMTLRHHSHRGEESSDYGSTCGTHGHAHQVPQAHTLRSNDPQAGASKRYRESPYPMTSIEDALEIIHQATNYRLGVIEVPLGQSVVGFAISEPVRALEAVPAFPASIVDGYAVRLSERQSLRRGVYPVRDVAHAGSEVGIASNPGELIRITTGAPLPNGANAVLMVEDTRVARSSADGKEELEVEVLTDQLKLGENVRQPGSDIEKGAQDPFGANRVIRPAGGELGWLISSGHRTVKVWRKPRVAILSTGGELVSHSSETGLRYGQVRDTNRPTLAAAVQARGFEVVDLGIAGDAEEEIERTILRATEVADVLITTGGASMGELDLLKPVIERRLRGRVHFGRVNMKPGKPMTFATIPRQGAAQHPNFPIFSLPGNPASAMVTFYIFVLPFLAKICSLPSLPMAKIKLAEELPLDASRPEYHRAFAYHTDDGTIHATGTGGQRSSRIGSMESANILIRKPSAHEYGGPTVPTGSLMTATVIGEIGSQVHL